MNSQWFRAATARSRRAPEAARRFVITAAPTVHFCASTTSTSVSSSRRRWVQTAACVYQHHHVPWAATGSYKCWTRTRTPPQTLAERAHARVRLKRGAPVCETPTRAGSRAPGPHSSPPCPSHGRPQSSGGGWLQRRSQIREHVAWLNRQMDELDRDIGQRVRSSRHGGSETSCCARRPVLDRC